MGDFRALPVPPGLTGERVDAGLARLLGLSRSKVAQLLADGAVSLDGGAPLKSDLLVDGQFLTVDLPAPDPGPQVRPEVVEGMRIVFEDDDIVVVDKPVGVAAHPSVGWTGPTVIGGLAGVGVRISTSGVPERRGIVQRLDVGTSGAMVVAKSELAYTMLKRAFRERTVGKTYHAVVQGHPDPLVGTIEAPIGRSPVHDYKYAVLADGRHSVTHYEVLEMFRAASLVEVQLETGRTHQIRVHFSALHHPCAGDPQYGGDPTLAARLGLERQWLHAVGLSFAHPRTGETVAFESDYPGDLAHALARLRASS